MITDVRRTGGRDWASLKGFGKGSRDSFRTRGCWQLVQAAGAEGAPAEADLRDDDRRFYSVLSDEIWQTIRLIYRVEGNVIVTNQPSSPRKERTWFALQPDGTLLLDFGGQRSRFHRGPKVAPET